MTEAEILRLNADCPPAAARTWETAPDPPEPIEVDREFLVRAYYATLDWLRVGLNEDVTRSYQIGDDGHDDLDAILELAAAIRSWYYEDQPEMLAFLVNNLDPLANPPEGYDFWAPRLGDLSCDGVPPFFHAVKAPSLWYSLDD